MSKKTLKKKVQAKPDVSKYAAPMVDSARDIWLAGLGAFSVAQQEGSKLLEQGSKLFEEGNKLFEKLVAEGTQLEKKTRDVTGGAVGDLRGGMESRVGAVRQQASDNWDKLEAIFEDRVARVLGRLGVPTADDVNKLSERVQELSRQVSAIGKARKTTAKKAAPKKAASKPAASKPAAKTGKKTAAKKAPDAK